MEVAVLFLVAVILAHDASAQIPIPCANEESLTEGKCCPTPDIAGADACGQNKGRGSCQLVSIQRTLNEEEVRDVRVNWPLLYFNQTCVCNFRYGGFDCGECSFDYNDGTNECKKKTVRPRLSAATMDDDQWKDYTAALEKAKRSPSRYMVVTANYTTDVTETVNSMVNPTHYDLFIWMHHLVAKDSDVTSGLNVVDYAHQGTGFPTWHRLYLIWLEREIQREIGNHEFRIPYWDWRNLDHREELYGTEKLGVNVDGIVEGDLFDNWEIRCWESVEGKTFPIKICNPNAPNPETLRRCPFPEKCQKDDPNWPSFDDVTKAVTIDPYDASPYGKYVLDTQNRSFRNFMEGFNVIDPNTPHDCGDDTMCSYDNVTGTNLTIIRENHNSVHIILGVGDIASAGDVPFEMAGTLGDSASSPNDPIFINHHSMVDCLLEEWIQRHKYDLEYPDSDEIPEGHGPDHYIIPFIPIYTHRSMFQTADNFGYECSLPDIDKSDDKNDDKSDDKKDDALLFQAHTILIVTILVAKVFIDI